MRLFVAANALEKAFVALVEPVGLDTYLPSETLGMKEYFRPEGKPAPPRPRKPDFLISSMIQSGPIERMSFV
jgi:hypothetical protein